MKPPCQNLGTMTVEIRNSNKGSIKPLST
uniref:Uncharacterized protein n=1 Tax=Arundo donax TaxID=35708 RepID=A0A0A8YIA5_ARUDO